MKNEDCKFLTDIWFTSPIELCDMTMEFIDNEFQLTKGERIFIDEKYAEKLFNENDPTAIAYYFYKEDYFKCIQVLRKIIRGEIFKDSFVIYRCKEEHIRKEKEYYLIDVCGDKTEEFKSLFIFLKEKTIDIFKILLETAIDLEFLCTGKELDEQIFPVNIREKWQIRRYFGHLPFNW